MVCSSFWKLDKVDKIVISLIFIVGALSSIFSCFCFAESPVNVSNVKDLSVDFQVPSGTIIYQQGASGVCFPTIPGHTYVINCPYAYTFVTLNSFVKEGLTYDDLFYPNVNKDYTFIAEDDYAYVFCSSLSNPVNTSTFSCRDITRVGFENVIDNLFLNVGISQFWSVFESSVPFVLIVVVCAIGFMLIFNMIKGLSKGKGRI